MAKSKQRSAKRPKGPVAQGRKPKGVLSTKSTNKTDSSNNAKVSEPTTPFDESFPSTVLTSENWPAAYLGNGDVLVDAIRSAASEMEKMHHPSDIESFELDADNQFHHYDVLDELLCEQVDPSLSVVPTPNSKATSNLPAKTASTSLEWDPVNSSTTIKWPLRVFEQNSWLEGIMSKISAFFSQTTFRLEANVSHWSGKLQTAIKDATSEQSLGKIEKTLFKTQGFVQAPFRTLRTARNYPYITLFAASFTLAFGPVFLLFLLVMSFTSIVIALLYFGGFLIILFTASAVILPLLILSLCFATGVVLCGFLSKKSYGLALRIYNLAIPHARSSMQAAADHIAPLDSTETVSLRKELLHRVQHFKGKSNPNLRAPIIVSGSEIPKSVIKVSETT